MDTGGGTGAPEQESGSENSDEVRVEIRVERLPVQIQTIGTAPNQHPVNVHTVRITTPATTITIEVRGYTEAPSDFLLLVGEEIVRAARSRVRQGTLQVDD